jgi:hypothetical protein
MAELQIFTGVSLDTGNETKRRAFIDGDGYPVPPVEIQKTDTTTGAPMFDEFGQPIMEPPPAEKLLAQKPDVVLHGSGNWAKGTNTGPAKVPDPNFVPDPDHPDDPAPLIPDPAKKLEPTGKIVRYKPDPSLNGPQIPDAPAAFARRAVSGRIWAA